MNQHSSSIVAIVMCLTAIGISSVGAQSSGLMDADFAKHIADGVAVGVYRFETDKFVGRRIVDGRVSSEQIAVPTTAVQASEDGQFTLHVQGQFALVKSLHGQTETLVRVNQNIPLAEGTEHPLLASSEPRSEQLFLVVGSLADFANARVFGPVDEERISEIEETTKWLIRTPYSAITQETAKAMTSRGPLTLRLVGIERLRELGVSVRPALLKLLQNVEAREIKPLVEQLLHESIREGSLEETLVALQQVVMAKQRTGSADAIVQALRGQLEQDRYELKKHLVSLPYLRQQLSVDSRSPSGQ